LGQLRVLGRFRDAAADLCEGDGDEIIGVDRTKREIGIDFAKEKL
jgi:hypothetical protein